MSHWDAAVLFCRGNGSEQGATEALFLSGAAKA